MAKRKLEAKLNTATQLDANNNEIEAKKEN